MPSLTRLKPTLEVSVDFAANPTASYADIHETDDGVVSFWRMDSTSTFLDELGINNGTQISTGSLTAGPYSYDSNQATTYDGTNDQSYVLNSASTSTNTGFSVDGWFKVASLPGSTKDLVAKHGAWRVMLTSAGKVLWILKDNTSTVTVTSNTTIATNTYYHVTGVYDDTTALLYINGVLDSSSAYASGMEFTPQPIRFGGAIPTSSPTFQSSTTNTGTSTSVTALVPASTASGDLLITQIIQRDNLNAVTPTFTPPTGWDPLWSVELTTGIREEGWAKVSDGTEGADEIWTASASDPWAAAMTRITGHDTVEWRANIIYGDATAAGTTHSAGAFIPNTDNTLIMSLFGARGGVSWTASSGTERYDFSSAGTTGLGAYTETMGSATSLTVTGTSSGSVFGSAHVIVITGLVNNETAVTLDDWTYWNRALDSDDVARNWESRNGGTPVWTNVTVETRHLSTSSAERRHELDVLAAGKMDMVLREVGDKDFDPGNTSSPYLPDIEQRVRVRATWNSTTYDVFRGYADQWRPVRLGADKEEVSVSASDGFDLLSLAPVSGTIPLGLSGSQIDLVLDKALWPLADRDIDAGQYVLNAYTLGEGSFALSALQEIAGSERGICFIDAAGVFHYEDAAHRGSDSRSTTSQATFSDYPGGTGNLVVSSEIRYQGIQPTRDKDKIINVWTVTPDSGVFGSAAQTMIDHESVARYGPRANSRSTRLATNSDALDQAGNLLTETAFPADRYEEMVVIPLTTESYDKCLDLRISDRITVKRGFTPGWPGASMTRDYFIEGKHIDMEPDTAWQFTFVLTPVSSGNYYQTIMRDGPVSYWRLDTIT